MLFYFDVKGVPFLFGRKVEERVGLKIAGESWKRTIPTCESLLKIFRRKLGPAIIGNIPGYIPVYIAVFVPVADKKVPDARTSGHRRKESAMKQSTVAALVGFALLLAFVMLVTIGLRDAGLI